MRSLSLLVGSVLLPTLSVAAQPAPGDLIVGDVQGDLAYVTWPNGEMKTLVPGLRVGGITPAADNDGVVCHLTDGQIVRVRGDGSVTPIAQLPATGGGQIVLDQDQSYLALVANGTTIYRIRGTAATPFYSQGGFPFLHGLTRNEDTGHFAYTDDSTGFWRLDRVTGMRQPFGAALEYTPGQMAFVKSVGEIWIEYPWRTVEAFDTDGRWRRSIFGIGGHALCADEVNDRVFLAATASGNNFHIVELTSGGTHVTTRSYGRRFTSIAVWGSRNVAWNTSGPLGTTAGVDLSFPRSPNRTYCAMMALTNRPGAPLAGQLLNLTPDLLFALSACSVTPPLAGFAGTTDGQGRAAASFDIPLGLPLPLSLQVGALAINPTVPGGFDVGNSDVVALR